MIRLQKRVHTCNLKVILSFSLFFFMLLPIKSHGLEMTVDNSGSGDFYTIQDAVDSAIDGDVIVITPGFYSGPGNYNVRVVDKAITIQSRDPNDPNVVDATVIDCMGTPETPHRAFHLVASGPDIVLAGLTIINGHGQTLGGAIKCLGSVAILRCRIMSCSAARGGAIYGSGLWSDSLSNNFENIRIANCEFNNNSAYEGGAVYTSSGRTIIQHCTFTQNHSNHHGGAIVGALTEVQLINTTLLGNQSMYGGGVAFQESEATLANCILVGNAALNNGGGVFVQSAEVPNTPRTSLYHCTIVSNTAEQKAGGVYIQSLDLATAFDWDWTIWPLPTFSNTSIVYRQIANCILWHNVDSNGLTLQSQITGNSLDVSYSCLQDEPPSDDPTFSEMNHNINSDPLLIRLPPYGTGDDFGDVHLAPNSPCIDAGDPLNRFAAGPIDMDGQPRLMGYAVDMGADEYLIALPPYRVTSPVEGQRLMGGTSHLITWEDLGPIGPLCLEFSIDTGRQWQTIDCNLLDVNAFEWQIPNTIYSDACLIRVQPANNDPDAKQAYSGIFSIHASSADLDIPSKWRTLAGNFQRNGQSQYMGPRTGCVQWQFDTPSMVTNSPTIGINGRIHVPTADGRLYCLDPTGKLIWTYNAASPIITAPTIGNDGTVYIGCQNGSFHTLRYDGSLQHIAYYSSVPTDSVALLSNTDMIVSTLDRDTYRVNALSYIVQTIAGGTGYASPTLGSDESLYLRTVTPPGVQALNPHNLSLRWHRVLPADELVFNSPVIGGPEIVYQTLLADTHLYALNTQDGIRVWSTDLADPDMTGLGNESWNEPVVSPDGTIYACLNDAYVRALDPNGQIKWTIHLGATHGFTMTVDNTGLLYAAGDDGWLHVIDPSGIIVSQFKCEGPLSFPIVSADHTLLITEADSLRLSHNKGTIWALSEDPACPVLDLKSPSMTPIDNPEGEGR